MHITFAPRGILQIDEAKIIFRNFAGTASRYNRAGDRNFAVLIEDQETADALIDAGWNVKIKPPREDGDEPFMYLPVKIKFSSYGPAAYLISGDSKTKLSEDTIECLDNIDIFSVDLDVRPYDWERPTGESGRTAYLDAIRVFQRVDRFAARFSEEV